MSSNNYNLMHFIEITPGASEEKVKKNRDIDNKSSGEKDKSAIKSHNETLEALIGQIDLNNSNQQAAHSPDK